MRADTGDRADLNGIPMIVVPAETAEELYEHAPCGYLSVLDDGRIIKVNQTLLNWTGHRREDLVGQRRFTDLLTPGGKIYHETHYAPLLAMQGSVREIALELACADGRRLPVLLNSVVARTADGSRVIRTSVFAATERRAYERELLLARRRAEASEQRARVLARTLQSSFLPPSTPSIPGMVVGAAYRPAGMGDEVGGDFYDIFRTADRTWAIVLGDVCGKGAAAAAVTALARHTVRAAAMTSSRPSEVLTTLNSALLAPDQERFCTAVYLQLRPLPGGAEITMAAGGHPLPLQMASDSTIEPVGAPGHLLGVLDEPELHDVTVTLAPGESLFCYTDGLSEGRRDDELFGEHRLIQALATHRTRSPADIPQAVVDDIVAYQRGLPKDDMAAVLVGAPSATR